MFCSMLLWLYACELFDKPEKIPSFIYIESISLEENTAINAGSLSSKIVDAWVFIDDQLIGAFELPATIPVLMEGEHKIAVYAGIYLNGVRTTRVYYPFYAEWKSDLVLVPDSIITIKPVVRYLEGIKLPFHENFELGGVLLEDANESLAELVKTNDPGDVFEGNYSGKIILTEDDTLYLGVSIQAYQLPTAGGHVFLEMNYKSESDIIIGVYAQKATQILQLEVAGVLPKEDWNKIYINLSPTVFRHTDAYDFKLFIGSVLPKGKTEATILIDNLKLIHL